MSEWFVFECHHEPSTGVYASEDISTMLSRYPDGIVKPFATIEEAFSDLENRKRTIVLSESDDGDDGEGEGDDDDDDGTPKVVPHSKVRRVETPARFEAFTFAKEKPILKQKTLSLASALPPVVLESEELTKDLDKDQASVLGYVQRGNSLFFTGSAGTGKSFLVGRIATSLKKTHGENRVAITASTGSAAVNIGGTTIHSWAGIGIANTNAKELAEHVQSIPKARNRIKNCRSLILDEVSMISDELFDKIEFVCRYVKSRSKEPEDVEQAPWFGGIQVILVGDFLQLPPVTTNEDVQELTYAFNSKAWKAGVKHTFVLRNPHRQADPAFVRLLDDARHGLFTEEMRTQLRKCVNRAVEFPVHLYSRRNDAANRNQRELDAIDSPNKTYKADDMYDSFLHKSRVEAIKRNWPADEIVVLKKGARVLLLRNMDLERGLCNGSQGVILGFKPEDPKSSSSRYFPEVLFRNGQTRLIKQETFTVEEYGMIVAMRMQVPLTLAYALTIHKSQGMTLDAASCDIDNTFANGQAYVAMSRTRKLDGLCLKSVPLRIHADPVAVQFHRSIGD